MKRLGIAIVAAALATVAHAADLPTTKAPEKAKPNCWASVWDWLNTSAADCPISAYGITLYGTLDLNATYLNEGVEQESGRRQGQLLHSEERLREQVARRLQRPQRLGDRPQDEGRPGPRRSAGLVADRRPRSGRESLFGHVPQQPALARLQQRTARQHVSVSERELRRQPRRPVGQLARLFGNQQSRLRHADLRPHQFARARRDVGLRSRSRRRPSRRSAFRRRSPASGPVRRCARTPPSPIA